MTTKQQKDLMEKVEKMLLQRRFGKFSVFPSRRGYQIVNPSIDRNQPFLDAFGESSGKDTATGGIVIAAIGFGNLDHEFPEATKAIGKYQKYLKEKGVDSEVIINSPEDMLTRGAYLFVPC